MIPRRSLLRALTTSCLAFALTDCGGPTSGESIAGDTRNMLAIVGARIYLSPTVAPIPDGILIMTGDVITGVGSRHEVRVPPGVATLDGTGLTVAAGFWNAHVHFTEARWASAGSRPAAELSAGMRAMLTRWGVVHAVDTGSRLGNTLELRRRVETGEIPGPQILIASGTFVPVGGSPYYVLPERLPELADAGQATALVDRLLEEPGVDAVKIFTGSFAAPQSIVVMPVEVARAAVEAAHRRGKQVIAHPSNSAGARVALEGGVDVLAHTFPSGADWDRSMPARMREANMAMIPTLKLWSWELGRNNVPPTVLERFQASAGAQVRAFAEAGGQLIFGTDVGYMTDYDPTEEYLLLARAGLSLPGILTMLTTAPAARFGAGSGVLAAGKPADLTVLDGDPAADLRALARVRYTIRSGHVIYDSRP